MKKAESHFYLFGHDKNHTHTVSPDTNRKSAYSSYKDTVVSRRNKSLKKYSSGLIEANFKELEMLKFYDAVAYMNGVQFSVIGDLKMKGSASIESFSMDYIVDEVSYQNGIVAVKEQNRYILYAKGAEDISLDKLVVYHYKPRYTKAVDLEKNSSFLSLKSTLNAVPAFNEIVIKGELADVKEAISSLRMLDRPAEKVSIELLVVEYRHGNNFQWRYDVTSGSAGRISDGTISPGLGAIGGTYNFVSQLSPSFKVNLQALVEEENANVVTNPHIMAVNNENAEINIKETQYIRLQQSGINGISTNLQQIDASLDLIVNANILSDQLISLDLTANNIEFSPTSTEDNIQTQGNKIQTKVIARNGETLIIGGLIKAADFTGDGGYPVLRKIPLIGLLFKRKLTRSEYVETVIYITPYMYPIVNKDNKNVAIQADEIQDKLDKKGAKEEKKDIKKIF